MYVVRDSVTPTILAHTGAMRFKNTVLRHWPSHAVADGTSTMRFDNALADDVLTYLAVGGTTQTVVLTDDNISYGIVVTGTLSSYNILSSADPLPEILPSVTVTAGAIVFDRLWTWTRGGGVNRSASALKIYKLIGIELSALEAQDTKGLNAMYLDVSGMPKTNVVTDEEIRGYIESFTPRIYPTGKDPFNYVLEPDPLTDLNPDPYKDRTILNADGEVIEPLWDKDGWITSYLTYLPHKASLINPDITDAEILAKCSGYHPLEILFDDMHFNRITGTAMMDSNGVLFERELRVMQRTVEERHHFVTGLNKSSSVGRYMTSAKVAFRFRRVVDVDDVIVDPLIAAVRAQIDKLNDQILNPYVPGLNYDVVIGKNLDTQLSINKQLIRMANYVAPYAVDGSNYLMSQGAGGYNSDDAVTVMRYDYLGSLKPREFTKQFAGHMSSGYDVKPAKWWEVVVVVVLVIIIIIIAIVMFIKTAGTSAKWAAASITLLIGSLAMTGLSMYWAENGSPMAAKFAAGGAEYLGYLAMATGIAGAVQNFAAQGAKQALLESAKSAALEGTKNAATTAAQQAALNAAVVAAQAGITSTLAFAGQALMYGSQVGSKIGIIDEETAMYASLLGGALTMGAAFGVGVVPINSIGDFSDVLANGVTKFAAMPTTTIMNQTLNFTNVMFNAYVLLVAPPNEGIEDLQAQLEAQEKEIETLSPDQDEAIWTSYTDPYGSIFEVGDIYEKSYTILTSGRNRLLMNKHYESGY